MTNPTPVLPTDLEFRIRQVERQFHQRMVMRAWVRFAVASLCLVLLATLFLFGAQRFDFPRSYVWTGFVIAEIATAIFLIFVPLRRKVDLREIALLIDEKHPELENRILSAVEFSKGGYTETPAWIIQKFLENSRVVVRRVSFADIIETDAIVRLFGIASLVSLVALTIILFFHDLWLPRFGIGGGGRQTAVAARDFTVEPGNARVRVGDNQVVLVKSDESGKPAAIEWRGNGGEWQTASMKQGSSEKVRYHQFTNIREDIEYQVRFGDDKSEQFLLATWTPPEVQSIDVTYHYPGYLELDSKEVPSSGNITAIEGTEVDLEVHVNKKLESAEIVLADGEILPLEEKLDSIWVGRLKVEKNDKYHVELKDADGEKNEYQRKYDITAQPDKPPTINIDFPRGDSEVSSLEEVPFTFEVTDDFGVSSYGLRIEVTGRDSVDVPLQSEKVASTEAAGAHELFLESMALTTGDLITWTVFAKDKKPGRDPFEEMGDPYFLEVRPFKRLFEEAMSNEGAAMQGGGGGGQQAGEQKDIVIAIWNLRRKAQTLTEDEFSEQRKTITEAQLTLMQQIQGAAMGGGIEGEQEAQVKEAVKEMTLTVEAVQKAALPEPKGDLSEAAEHAQKAYMAVLKLEGGRVQVQQGQQGQGGGGGQRFQQDMNELEMSRNRNFYEEEKRTQQQQQATEEVRSKIKDLAERQQIINEEIARLISEMEKAKTEEERRELERQLERLREEEQKNLNELDEIQRDIARGEMSNEQSRQAREQLNEAREQMNRSLEQMEEGDLQQARSAGSRAQNTLDDISEKLQKLTREGAANEMRQLTEQMQELQKREQSVLDQIEAMKQENEEPDLSLSDAGGEKKEQILKEKEELSRKFVDLMNEAGQLAEQSSDSQELMSRRLGDWLRETSREGIPEDIEEGESLVRYGIWDSAVDQELSVKRKLDQASEKLQQVAQNAIRDDLDGMQKALNEIEDLMDQMAQDRAGQQGQAELSAAAGRQQGEEQQRGAGQAKQDGEQPAAGQQGKESQEGQRGEQESQQGRQGEQQGRQGEQPGRRPGDQQGRGSQQGEQQGQEGKQGQQPGQRGRQGEQGQEGQQGDQQGRQSGQRGRQGEQGQQPGQQGQQGEQGEQQGQQSGRQSGQQGQQQGQQEGQQGEQQGQQSGQQGEQQGQQGGQQGRSSSANQQSGPGRGGWNQGGWNRDFRQMTQSDMQNFFENEYREWDEQLRNAEALLPGDSPMRAELQRVRDRMNEMRNWYRRHSLAPQYDLFLNDVLNPTAEVAGELELEIMKRLKEKEFVLIDDGSIPANYRKKVARYFESLSESEGTR